MDVKKYQFENGPVEELNELISRRYVSGETAMLARFDLKKGAIVPEHRHPNEQITYIVSGLVVVHIEGKEYRVGAGEVLVIPSNVPHMFEALEDTIDIDIFSPPRQDWISGTDSYIQKKRR